MKYRPAPEVMDIFCFCTKNPAPMLPRLAELDRFRQFWFVTLTLYGKEIEPNVPDKIEAVDALEQRAERLFLCACFFSSIFELKIHFTKINIQIIINTCLNRIRKCVLFGITDIKIINQNQVFD